jgi:heterodisulfide reductase subunit B
LRPYAYYPGCSLEGTAKEYQASLRAIAGPLGIELHELPDWTCCGSSAAHATSHLLGVALAGRNLNAAAATAFAVPSARGAGLLVPCAACYSRLRGAAAELNADAELRARFAAATGEAWSGGEVAVKSLVEVLAHDLGPAEVAAKVTRRLSGVRIACYYGCLLLRPTTITGFDDPETPTTLDRLVQATGASAVEWSHKTECCGAGLSISKRAIVGRLVGEILSAAAAAKADAIVVACPMCHANLDTRQDIAGAATGERFSIPVLYITQLIGLALGLTPRQLALGSHFTPVVSLLTAIEAGSMQAEEVARCRA